jgi:chromosome segregation ATPase
MAQTKIRGNTQIKPGTITHVEIAANADIKLSQLEQGMELILRDGSVAFTGSIDLGNNQIKNVAAPTEAKDAANKEYVDTAITSVRTDIDAAELRLDEVEAKNIEQDGRLFSVESKNTEQDDRLDSAEGRLDEVESKNLEQDGRLDSVEAKNLEQDGRITSAEGRLDDVEAKNIEQDGRITSVEIKNTEQDGRLTAVESKNTEQDGRLTAVESKNTEQDGRLTAVEDKNTEQDSRLAAVESKNIEQDGRLDDVESKNLEQDERLDDVESKNVEQDGRLDDVESKNVEQDGRLDDVETNLSFPSTKVYENNAAVYADAKPGIVDPQLRDGWYFKNTIAGDKVNWYFYDGQTNNIQLSQFSGYAVVTVDNLANKPFLVVYTTPQLDGNDSGAFYRSVRKYSIPSSMEAGKKYLVYFGDEPKVRTDLPRLELSLLAESGPLASTERVLTTAFHSDSQAAVNSVEFVVEALGVSASNFKLEAILKIRHATQASLDKEIADRIAGDAATLASANAYTDMAIENLINGAPEFLDTLKELADALANDPNFAATIAGQFNSVFTRLDDIEDKNIEQDGRLDSAEDRLDSVEAKNVEQDGRLDGVESKNIEQDGRLNSVESKNVEQDGRLDDVESKNVEQDGRLDSVEAKNVEQDGRLDSAKLSIEELEQNLAAEINSRKLEDSLLESRIIDVESSVSEIKDQVGIFESDISDLESKLAAEELRAKSAESYLQDQIDSITTDIGVDLEGRVTAVEAKNVEQDGRLDDVESKNVEIGRAHV